MRLALDRAEGMIVAKRYRLIRKLGEGGMGSVWLAHDLSLDSRCALKLIDADKAQNAEVRIRFEREARAAAQLRGAHVVDVFDHGEFQGILYIAMEYLEGEDLGARLDRVGSLDPETTYRIVAHVARALTRAHANGIVHRDLKPENIFLVQGDEEETAKVLDFGIAKHDAYSLQDKATRTGSFLGTPYYVSPEQARGKSIDHRSDLWSLGIITFQCLTGHPPFESEALGELMGLILYEDLPRLTLHHPELPPAIDVWWERAAARDREQRFNSAKEMADALGEALGLSKLITVPSLPPRHGSIPDGSGAFPAASGSDSFAKLVAELSKSQARLAAPAIMPDVGPMEERTDAPVSRTRHPGLQRVGSAWTWFSRLKEQRKRTLVVAAVVAGVTAGVLLTLFFVRAQPDPTPVVTWQSSAAASLPAATARNSDVHVEPKAQPAPASAKPGEATTPSAGAAASAAASASAQRTPAPVDLNTLPTEESSAAKKRAPPPPRRRPAKPDYGI